MAVQPDRVFFHETARLILRGGTASIAFGSIGFWMGRKMNVTEAIAKALGLRKVFVAE